VPRSHRQPRSREGLASEFGVAFEFLRALWELNHALESASRTMKKRLGVTGPERLFIRIVGQQPGLTPREIARALRVHPSSVSVLIKRLESRCLIARGTNPSDARSFQLYLTPDGQRADALHVGTIEMVVREAVEAADPRHVHTAAKMLMAVAERLASRMGPTSSPGAARRRPGRSADRR